MEDTAVIKKKKNWSSSAGSFGKKMGEKEKIKKRRGKNWPSCFLKARDFSSSLNDRHKQMTGERRCILSCRGQGSASLMLRACLSSIFYLGSQRGTNETELAFFGPSQMTAAASHGHLGHLAPDVRWDRGATAEGFQGWPGLLMH